MKSIRIHVYKVESMMAINDAISENETEAKESALNLAKNRQGHFKNSDCEFIAVSFSGDEILKK